MVGWCSDKGPSQGSSGSDARALRPPQTTNLLRAHLAIFTRILFILTLRRAGERAGWMAERVSTSERTHEIQRKMLDAAGLLIAVLLLVGCETVSSNATAGRPPIVEYSASDQTRAAIEIEACRRGNGDADGL